MDSTKKKINLLIGLSGSVATIKYLNLIKEFLKCPTISFTIKVVATQNASFFLEEEHKKSQIIKFSEFPEFEIPVYMDKDEWNWKQKGDSILHIELKKWANVFLIAPLSANTLAKISSGICDNLLTCIARAWDFNVKPNSNKILIQDREYNGLEQLFIVAPAMNTFMFEHPLTEKQIKKLRKLNIIVLNTIKKLLACGDEGFGAMEETDQICKITTEIFLQKEKNI